MNMFSRVVDFFRAEPPTSEALEAGSTAWSDFTILMQRLKYNPDELIHRKGFRIYRQMMLDEQVKSVIQFRRAAVTGREWYFTLDAKKHGISEAEAKKRVRICEDMVDCFRGSWQIGLNKIMKATWQGFSFTEKIFDIFESDSRPYWGVSELRSKPFESFQPDVNEFGDVLGWYQVNQATGQERRVDITKFVYYVNNPEFDEHFGESELRSAHRSWFHKDFLIQFMSIFAERLAGGFIVARPSSTSKGYPANSPEYVNLTKMLSSISAKTSMLLPTGYELEVHYAPGQQAEVYLRALEWHDIGIAKSLLMPNLLGLSAPSAASGGFSQSDTHFDVFLIVSDDDANRLAEVVNEQIFKPLGVLNFEDGITPEFKFKKLSERKKRELAKQWADLVSKKAVVPTETDDGHLRDMLGFPEAGEPLEFPEAAQPGPTSGTHPEVDGNPRRDRISNRVQPADVQNSLGGTLLYTREAFARAERRVSFAVIAKQSDGELARYVPLVEGAVAELVAEALARIAERGLGSDLATADQVAKFQLNSMKLQPVRTQIGRALRAGFTLGESHALRELNLAHGEAGAPRLAADRLGDMAAEWLKARSFIIAGDINGGISTEIKTVLANALKFSWTSRQITQSIYRALLGRGFLSATTAADALGYGDTAALAEALDIQGGLTPYRLETIVRTTMFEAINEARFNVFTEPVLEGFVRALEYSAILDSRTTEICTHLDGRVYAAGDEVWNQYRPPNHFNCRSILIPVTVRDEVPVSPSRPTLSPQEGFDRGANS